MPVLLKENFNRWYSLKSYYMAITISDIPFQVRVDWDLPNCCLLTFDTPALFIPGYFLRRLRGHRVLLHEPADGVVPVPDVPLLLPPDFLCRAECGPGRGCGYERAERSILSARHVRSLPALLRFLRELRRDSGLPAVDHLPVVHPIRIRGHCLGHLRLWTRETKVLPDLLPLQVARDDSGGAGHVGRELYSGHCCLDHNLLGVAHYGLLVLALEDPDGEIRGIWGGFRVV